MNWNLKSLLVWQKIVVALLSVSVVTAFRAIFLQGLGDSLPYVFFYPAVLFAALFGGLFAGLLATGLSSALTFFWIQKGVNTPHESVGMIVFVISCVIVTVISKMMRTGHLRATIAAVEAAESNQKLLAEMAARARTEAVQTFLAQTSSGNPTEPFFNALACHLAQGLEADFVCIDRLEGDGLNATTVAVWSDGHFEDNVTYALKDTPCGDVVGKEICCFPANVCQFFPRDQVLHDLRADSYIGATLWSHSGEPIGLIAVIGRKPLADRPFAEDLLKTVSGRAAGELERLAAENELLNSREDLSRLLNSMVEGAYGVDLDGNCTFVNRECLKLLGYESEHEMLGKHVHTLIHHSHPDGSPYAANKCRIYQAFRANCTQSLSEEVFWTKKGVAVPVELRSRPVEKDGVVIGAIASFIDISERIRAEETRREAEDRYRALFDGAGEGIFFMSLRGKLLQANEAFARMHGYTREEISQMNLSDLDTPDTLEKAPGRMARMSAGESLEFEVEHYHKDGHIIKLAVSASSITVGGETLIQALHRDITHRKQVEKFQLLSNDVLTILNSDIDQKESIQAVLREIKHTTNYSSVGMRLKQGDDFPFYSQIGFTNQFLRKENSLIAHDTERRMCLDEDGKPKLECTCGLVISSKTDHNTPVLTKAGSFWTNDSYPLLDLPPGQDPRFQPRNTCIHLGYGSVAIIPIKADGATIGTLQLNDKKTGAFTVEAITSLEGVCLSIGSAFMRKQAEAALRESEIRYRTLVDGMMDGVYRSTPDGRFVEINGPMLTMFGYSTKEEMMQVDIRKELYFAETDRGTGGLEKIDIFLMRKKDGSGIWVEDHGRYVRDEIGNIIYHEGILRDVTERIHAEGLLSKSEALLRESQSIAGLGNYILDISTGAWSSSDVLDGLFGIEAGHERSIEAWTSFLHPDDRSMMTDYFSNEVVGRKQVFDKEYRIIRHNDQAVRWVHGLGRLTFDAEGRPVEMRGTIQDITERKLAEKALRESEEIFSSAFEYAPIGITIISPDGKWLRANRTFCDLLGYSESEILSLSFQDLTVRGDTDLDTEHNEQLLSGKIPSFKIEKSYMHRLGHLVPTLVNVSLIRDSDDEPRYFLSQVQDLTALRELEERFRQSQKMEAIGVLAGGVAHDFNNLLTVINGYSSLILSKLPSDDPLRSNVIEVKEAGERAAELTARLLAFSRKQVVRPTIVDLNSIITDTEKMLRRLIRECVELFAELDPGIGNIEADAGQIEQMILNLAINASDAMPNGGILSIKTEDVILAADHVGRNMTISPGRYVKLTISDTGEGMSSETQSHIFEPFFTTKEVGKGTGLGLSTVYGVVKFSGGDIAVESQPDKGAVFTIYLPTIAVPVKKTKLVEDDADYRGTETILLVEDEDMVRSLVVSILTNNGFNVLQASNGMDALSICESHTGPIDMLLTDIVMPKMSGVELKEKVVKINPEMRILFMSGYTQDAIEFDGVAGRYVDFIGKPFKYGTLAAKVRELLDR